MSVVEEIKERLDIVEVISAYTPLRKAGSIYKGLCPFHQEKTPSFVVYPDRGTWHCFGACGTGGDVFSFIMKRENLDFREAMELLAQKAGVDLAPPSAQRSEQETYLDRLREINQAAALYFHYQLRQGAPGQLARDYMAGRGFTEATIDAFQLGYAPDRWDALLHHLLDKQYTTEDILAAGLIIERENPEPGRSPYYDRFRHRLMVPIRDLHGHIIGFGARALRSDQQPKYLNTAQTPLFDKSGTLYGLDVAKRFIRPRGKAIIVEGYMDVLACHQAGENNVVASMGTALTEPQIKQLRRYTDTIVLALDADAAGQAATVRGLTQAREAIDREWIPVITPTGLVRHEARLAIDLRVMTLPEGMDPDDVVRTDPTAWRELVNNAQPVVDYYFDLARRELDINTAAGKSEAVDRLSPLILEVSDEVKRAHYVQQLARLIQTDERSLERMLLKRRKSVQPARPQPAAVVMPEPWDALDPGEMELFDRPPAPTAPRTRPQRTPQATPATHCLALLVLHPDMLPDLQAELAALGAGPLDEDDFSQADEQAICAALVEGRFAELDANASALNSSLLTQLHAAGRSLPTLPRDQLQEDMLRAVLRLRINNLKARARTLPALTRSAKEENQTEDVRAYQQRQQAVSEHLRQLEHMLNQRTHAGRRQMSTSL